MKMILSEALKMLPKQESIRTLRQVQGYLSQTNYSKEFVISLIKEHGVYRSGETAKKLKYGLVVEDGIGELFIETCV